MRLFPLLATLITLIAVPCASAAELSNLTADEQAGCAYAAAQSVEGQTEPVLDRSGEPVLDEDGDPATRPVTPPSALDYCSARVADLLADYANQNSASELIAVQRACAADPKRCRAVIDQEGGDGVLDRILGVLKGDSL